MLQRALDSIAGQTVLPHKIYLIVDEAEGENDYSFLEAYSAWVKIQFTGGGYGGAAARNLGLELITSEDYIFFLDDDDEWCSTKIQVQLDFLEKNQNIIGITCWNQNVAHKTHNVQRVNASRINRYIAIWNTVGSFSFFGYRLTSETRTLRLCEKLSAAQDWEFYIQISQLGEFSVIEDYLVRYYEHDEFRITGNADTKSKAWELIYQKYRSRLSMRQRWLHLAKIYWKYSERETSVVTKSSYAVISTALAALSFQRLYSLKIIFSSTSSVLRGMGLKK